MHHRSLSTKSILLNLCLLLMVSGYLRTVAAGQPQQPNYAAERQRAFALYEDNKFADALPIFERLVKVRTDDVNVWERLGWATLVVSASIQDPTQRKQARERARFAFQKAQALGDDSNLLKQGMSMLNAPDPAELSFSLNKEADAAMREGE